MRYILLAIEACFEIGDQKNGRILEIHEVFIWRFFLGIY